MKYISPIYKVVNRDIKEILFTFDFHKYGEELVHRFSVYKHGNKTLVWCSFIIYEDDMNTMHINVYDMNGISCNYNREVLCIEYHYWKRIMTMCMDIYVKIRSYIIKHLIIKHKN